MGSPKHLLDRELPIWLSELDGKELTDRLDNNWYSPAAALAEIEIARSAATGKFQLLTLKELAEDRGIQTGDQPVDGGSIGLIEGRNLRPNYVIPLFVKFGTVAMDIIAGDILIGKDGEPGTAALITAPLMDFCESLTVGGHVYHIRLKAKYRPLAPFISAFLNSKNGQAVIRKRIAGGTTPTIRKDDIESVPVLIPADGKCPADIRDSVLQTQIQIIKAMDNLGPSKGIAERAGMEDVDVRLPTNWAGGGAQRSSRIIS